MRIDLQDGTVVLPNGFTIRPSLTQDGFREEPMFAHARAETYGAPPWMHYRLAAGQVEGKELGAKLCFHDQLLVNVELWADLYPPGARDWSDYSVEVETATKAFHERLLETMLGPAEGPTGGLDRPAVWKFAWGQVGSYHDAHGGSTFIRVSYGNRKEEVSRLRPLV